MDYSNTLRWPSHCPPVALWPVSLTLWRFKLERFSIYAISFGGPTVIAYAARHPEKVRRLVFYGTYARFIRDAQERRRWEAMVTLMRTGWGSDNPAYRQMFTSLFMPDGSEVDQRVLNEMGRVAASPENAAAFMTATLDIDVRKLARQIIAPTLVVHVRGDQVVPFDSGRELAALIPGARMAVIEGRDHIPVPGDGEQEQLVQAVFPFLDEDTQKAATTGSSTRFIARARNGKGRAYRSFVSTTR